MGVISKSLMAKNFDYVIKHIISDDHCEPTWSWYGDYPKDWEKAKKDWSGKITANNMIVLKNFRVID